MRLLPILLMVVCCSASAEWLLFSKADNGDKHYVDLTKMQTNKHLVRILSLVNFSQPGSDGLLSDQIHEEFDCSKERVRALSLSRHSEHFAGGKKLHSQDKPGEWTHIPPETALSERFLIACR
jgi:predicted amidohydrolase